MFIVRLLILPFVWAFLAVMAVMMLIIGGLSWVIDGKSYTVRLIIGNRK